MAKKKGKRKGKKKKADLKPKTSEEIFLEQLTATVSERLKKEKWDSEDAELLSKMKKKKLSKKDKARLAAKRAEELFYAVEQEKIRLVEEERHRQEEERKAAIEKEARDKVEQAVRLDHLAQSCGLMADIRRKYLRSEAKSLAEAEWEQYLKCDGLPDPSNCGQMNTYLHLWERTMEFTSIAQAASKTVEVLSLLNTLDDFLDCAAASQARRTLWLETRDAFREHQRLSLDYAAYRLLRDIDGQLTRVNIPTAAFAARDSRFTLCLWALVQLPIPMPNPKRPPPDRVVLTFPEMQLDAVFPPDLNVWAACVRAMYVTYDHYSHLCPSNQMPQVPQELLRDLKEETVLEWDQKQDILVAAAANRKVIKSGMNQDTMLALLEEKKKQDHIKVDPSATFVILEDQLYAQYREQLLVTVEDDQLNLRKYRIIGGVYFLDLFYQPPQPSTLVQQEITIATLQIPKWLSEVPFHVSYEPPPPPSAGATRKPEEIEAEMKKQEEEFEKLILVSLSLPTNVLWLDIPVVCQWDSASLSWRTSDVHDVHHNEEKQTVQFRTGRFGPFAMALFRYTSMPYQAWELRPDADGTGVLLSIVGAVLVVEFTVRGGLVCLSQLQNAPSEALDSLVGVYYKLPKLKRLLQQGGVDVFPDCDAFCYTKGACEKQWPMERHLYFTMAQCAQAYNFASSRWNALSGRRKAVMQMREWPTSNRVKLANHSMVMVTPLKALIVDCSEVSQTFIEEGVANMKFHSDLYHLIMNTSSLAAKKKVQKAPCSVINTVALLLNETRILSFS